MDSFNTKSSLSTSDGEFNFYNLKKLDVKKHPKSLKILLENLLRHEDGNVVTKGDIEALVSLPKNDYEISFYPSRVLMQDFTGVPAIVDLSAMRDAASKLNKNPDKINPVIPVDLVIDHSLSVDKYASKQAFDYNVKREFERNLERYEFLKWAKSAFNNLSIVPPGTGICHQINLEYLAKVVMKNNNFLYPDTCVGTDSHTTMVNGIGVLGWGVGGIEAESAMLGEPISMLIPKVIGVKIVGDMPEGITATDLVLRITEALRKLNVVGKFVEFYGDINSLSLADRATISNMAPEYGATCGFFPVDDETLSYLKLTNRDKSQIKLVEQYSKEVGLWLDDIDPTFEDSIEINLSKLEPSLAGPKRPQDRIVLKNAKNELKKHLENKSTTTRYRVENESFDLANADVVIAAITSCTNTSNPQVMIAAGLVAKKANELGLKVKPWVKTSLAPGSQIVSEYLEQSGLQEELNKCGFYNVGYGCTTCIGNSGPINENIANTIKNNNLSVASVLSGNRNFEGRISPYTTLNYLASPPLVVAYAFAGTMDASLDNFGDKKISLKDIWPTNDEIKEYEDKFLTSEIFEKYKTVFDGTSDWRSIKESDGSKYNWSETSTYIKKPPFFENIKDPVAINDIVDAKILAILGDSTTTDHISPAGTIAPDSAAGIYLKSLGINVRDFNSFGARRGNHEVMMRGTFSNIRLRNKMVDKEGGFTLYENEKEPIFIYDASQKYQKNNVPLIVIAGKDYGMGSSRDWAAKGTSLLGVKAVIAKSFERIHRSNLIGMGVLPLEFTQDVDLDELAKNYSQGVTIKLNDLSPGVVVEAQFSKLGNVKLKCRIDTNNEFSYYKNKGILHYFLKGL